MSKVKVIVVVVLGAMEMNTFGLVSVALGPALEPVQNTVGGTGVAEPTAPGCMLALINFKVLSPPV